MSKVKSIFVIFIGMVSVGLAAIFIRLCNASPLVIATYRMGLSAIFIAPLFFILERDKLKCLDFKKDVLPFVLLGGLLAAHFVLWISSLSYTTVLASTVLVTTNPIFVAGFSFILFRESTKKGTIIGIIIAFVGGMIIAFSAKNIGLSINYGNFLALMGAIAVSFYLIIGKKARKKFNLITYIFFVYSFAAAILIIISILTRQNLFYYPKETYFYFFLLAFIPQIIGHTAFNWALKYFSAPFVAVTILGEPVFATFFALIILHETPIFIEFIGGALILLGVYLSTRSEVWNIS
ncbi:MAG: EamA/RhaT family transporter [Caldiserica bacterium]|nr:MAG: EamA/RhaT family transporter [Caldisericota bacterium]